jgi:hypothetical protein
MTVLVVDIANVMGSRPNGWWRDRAGAATTLLASLVPLIGTTMILDEDPVTVDRIVAVVEGQARAATAPPELEMVQAPADGDTTIVLEAEQIVAASAVPLVITADRGLRARLPSGAQFTGPSWLLAHIPS